MVGDRTRARGGRGHRPCGLCNQLRDSLALLAVDGPTALAGVPEGTCKPDELALDYDNVCGAVLGNFGREMPAELTAALRRTPDRFDEIAGSLWTEAAVCDHPAWQAIRDSAGEALPRLGHWRAIASRLPDVGRCAVTLGVTVGHLQRARTRPACRCGLRLERLKRSPLSVGQVGLIAVG